MNDLAFRAMGSDAHVIVLGGAPDLADVARDRIDELEQRWSRFVEGSEVNRLTDGAGEWVAVSADTQLLVERAVEGWRLSAGRVDPTVLGAVLRAGYDRPFEQLVADAEPVQSALLIGCTDIEVRSGEVRLPAGTGFDPGGIGKGLAADLVAAELVTDGAEGVCINLGGDLRLLGASPDGAGWTVAIEHPWRPDPLANVGLLDGAVATSTTLKRAWNSDGERRHHLIDPTTGEPSTTDINLVTVIAGDAWKAEVLAKAVLLRGSDHPFDIIGGTGAAALAVTDDGTILLSDGFAAFLGPDQELPVALSPLPTSQG
ncbi:MAG: FAD:protein transferase [Acidimicrobiaceae bacterium]